MRSSGVEKRQIGLMGARPRTVESLGAMLEAGGYRVRGGRRVVAKEALSGLRKECAAVVVEALDATELAEALEELARCGEGDGYIAVTDAREVGLRVRLVEAGVGDVVARPLASAELLARVRFAAERSLRPGLAGDLHVAGLSEVLMLLHQQRASGELRVGGSMLTARIWMERGVLLGARASRGLWGEKALFRALRVFEDAEGSFEFREESIGPAELGLAHFEPIPSLILRGAQHADEFRALRSLLPAAPLRLGDASAYNDRCAEVLAMLQRDTGRSWTVDALIDASPLLDLEVARQIHEALSHHEVCCVQPPRHDPAGC